jgi:DNA-binding response OmpR family regulator
MTFNELVIEEDSRQVYLADEPVDLTPTEYELLLYLAQNQGQVLTHNQLIETLWPLGQGSRHSLFVHINRLRAKLEPDPQNPRFIVTRWGVGYTFAPKKRGRS